ncbi:MAG: thioredoxin-disulfide reductase [Candidatus Delongbacteria bacterium]|jgi:thioredoxin reductase (NADPH)|nr:thioredoxin-disulfide reductase [Candidatus Delongbacteria bacterium]
MKKYDTIIIGAGPAGLTAGIYLARAKRSVLIIDSGSAGGQMILTHKIANYPGVLDISGYELANNMKKQAKSFGCKILSSSDITKLDIAGKEKFIQVDGEDDFSADSVIIATGGEPRSLGLDSEKKFKGKGISYCATCDGDFFQDKDIVVIGGGNSALEEAVSLTKYASSVTIVHQFDHFQGYEHAIREAQDHPKIKIILESDVEEFIGDESLTSVRIKSNKDGSTQDLNVTGGFIFIGYIPRTSVFKDILDINNRGEILVDSDLKTNVKGVFAAGDVIEKKVRQVTTAVSDGSVAALGVIDFLNSH